jgi:hypothetical protein
VPAVAVLNGKALYGALVDVVVLGFVNPDRDASTFDPHESVERITRTDFVAADRVVVQDWCISMIIVCVLSVAWASGPSSVNIPTAKLYFVTSAPGSCDQHKV